MKKLFFVAAILAATLINSSCSNGISIPQPVCEYGTDICQTLEFLCNMSASNKLDSLDIIYLQRRLAELDKQVKSLKTETIVRSNQ